MVYFQILNKQRQSLLEILQNSQETETLKKETLSQVLSCEFFENFKNTFFYRTPPVAAPQKNWNIYKKDYSLSLDHRQFMKNTKRDKYFLKAFNSWICLQMNNSYLEKQNLFRGDLSVLSFLSIVADLLSCRHVQ